MRSECAREHVPLAWLVYPLDEPVEDQRTAIVFEAARASARSKGAQELGVEVDDVDAERAPAFDTFYSQKHIPVKALLREGWRVDCVGCGSAIVSPYFDEDSTTDLSGVVEDGGRVFCNRECKHNLDLSIARHNEKYEAFKQRVTRQRPDLTFTDFQGLWPQVTLIAKFSFPGAQFGGSVRDQLGNGDLVWSVAQSDLPTWEAYERARSSSDSAAG